MKKFTSINDISNLSFLIKKVLNIKKNPFLFKNKGINKTIGLVFFQPSLRTRLSSQKAAFNIGANVWIMNIDNDSWKIETSDGIIMENSQEHIKEAISVMSLYCDILAVRIMPNLINKDYDYKEILLKKIISYSKVPVISLESATLHPLQSLADVVTIEEFRSRNKNIKVVLTWAPHIKALPHSVANSFIEWSSQLNKIDLVIVHPKGYELNKKFTKTIKILNNQNEAFKNADFIYAKNWSSFYNYGKIICTDKSWMITNKKMSLTNNAKFMHCLPIRRNIVVEDLVLDSEYSIVLQQAENRIFAAQTIFIEILENIMKNDSNI